MVAGFFTKPSKGALFKKLRRVIMRMDHISILEIDIETLSPPAERVGDSPVVRKESGGIPVKAARSYADVVQS